MGVGSIEMLPGLLVGSTRELLVCWRLIADERSSVLLSCRVEGLLDGL